VLWLTHVHNTGAAFGMLAGWGWAFIVVSVAVLAVIGWAALVARPESGVVRLGLALVAGGAAGNLIDRVLAGGVTDFIDVGWWPVFNVADIALDCGVALIVGWLLFGQAREKPEEAVASGAGSAEVGESAPDDGLPAHEGTSDSR
jgi:signal peptidase II